MQHAPNPRGPILCQGSPRQMGSQYGAAASASIHASLAGLFQALQHGPYQLGREQAQNLSLTLARRYEPNIAAMDPDYLDWLRGLAQGAGIDYPEALALACYLEIAMFGPFLLGQAAGMCTAFALGPSATRDGTVILGQNIDWGPDTPVDLLHCRHEDGTQSLSLCFMGSPLYHLSAAGSDAYGNCSTLTLAPAGPLEDHVPLAAYLWTAMRQPSLVRAMEVLDERARGLGAYLLADANGSLTAIESVHDDVARLEPHNDVLVHANHYQTPRFAARDLAPACIPDSPGREARLRKRIAAAHGSITPEMMMEFLADHEPRPGSICRHVDPQGPPEAAVMTRASFVMVPTQRTLHVAFGPPCKTPYRTYTIESE